MAMNTITNQTIETSNQINTNQNPNEPQVNTPTDFFSQLIANFFQQLSAAPITDKPETKDLSQQTNSDVNQTVEQQDAQLDATLLQQLVQQPMQQPMQAVQQSMQTLSQNPTSTGVEQTKATVLEQFKQLNTVKIDNNTQNTQQVIEPEKQALAAANQALPSQMMQLLKELNNKDSNFDMPQAQAILQSALNSQQINATAEMKTPTLDMTNNILPTLNPFQTEMNKLSITSNIQKAQITNVGMEKNKYTDALVQLGQFVNNQTTQMANEQTTRTATVMDTQQTTYAEVLSKAQQPDYGLKVDIHVSGADSGLQDTYSANIKIYPPELGSMIAKLKVSKNGTELVILTENNHVKEIVQANLNQLRQDFQRADINLTNIQIDVQNQQSGQKENTNQNQQNFSSQAQMADNVAMPQLKSTSKSQAIDSIIDTYA